MLNLLVPDTAITVKVYDESKPVFPNFFLFCGPDQYVTSRASFSACHFFQIQLLLDMNSVMVSVAIGQEHCVEIFQFIVWVINICTLGEIRFILNRRHDFHIAPRSPEIIPWSSSWDLWIRL